MEGPAARTSYPQRTSSGQAVDEQILSSVPPNPTASDQTTLADSLMIDMGIEEERSPSEHRANETEIDDSEQTSRVNDEKYIRDKLYPAAIRGDWQEANSIYESNHQEKDIWVLPITQQGMNTLQVAVAAKQKTFVKEVLDCMTDQQLEFQNKNEDTALIINALSGNVEIAKMMVKMNKNLTMIRNRRGSLPLLTAAMHRQRDMVVYLYSVTEFNELNDDERIKLLLDVISCDLFVIADEIIIQDPKLATAEDKNGSIALEKLARKPFAIGSRRWMSAWEKCIGSC